MGLVDALVQRGVVPLRQFAQMLGQGPPIGREAHAGQHAQRGVLFARKIGLAQQVQATGSVCIDTHALRSVCLLQFLQRQLQRHLVGGRLRVHHHQIARQPTPGPQMQGLYQRTHQTYPMLRADFYQQLGAVTRYAEAPQRAPIAQVLYASRQCPRPWARVQQSDQRG